LTGFLLLFLIITVNSYDPKGLSVSETLFLMLIGLALLASNFYIVYAVAVPYLLKKKPVLFLLFNALLVICFTYLGFRLVSGYLFLIAKTDQRPIRQQINFYLWNHVLISLAGWTIKIIEERVDSNARMQELEKEAMRSELAFLRSQINPHEIFNILNTVYFQIDDSNTEARRTVENLSEILRYQLYECDTEYIAVEKEIAHLQCYITLQTNRLEPGTAITTTIGSNVKGFSIPPMLIQPLIENAFKHLSNQGQPADNKIDISLLMTGKTFTIAISNTIDAQPNGRNTTRNSNGIGLENIRRRLNLIFGNDYEMDTQIQDHIYTTTLKIRTFD
jgi:two-component system LytT family sensor kinase